MYTKEFDGPRISIIAMFVLKRDNISVGERKWKKNVHLFSEKLVAIWNKNQRNLSLFYLFTESSYTDMTH